MPVFPKNKSGVGAACLSCCPVELETDCTILDCAHEFTNYVLTYNNERWTNENVWDLMQAVTWFQGWMRIAVREMPIVDGTPCQTYGRAQIGSLIRNWQVEGADISKHFQEIERLLHPFVDGYIKDECECTAEELGKDCEALAWTFGNIQLFNRIGTQGFPANLDEFENGGVCGVCYIKCDGTTFIGKL